MRQGWLVSTLETEDPQTLFSCCFLFCQEVGFFLPSYSERSLEGNMKHAFWELNVLVVLMEL